jgi:aryl-alcohol dehydrogenase-like predicted oxidoreductase
LQIPLAWVLAQGNDIVTIPGRSDGFISKRTLGAERVQLTSADLSRLDELVPKGVASGARYPAATMNLIND